jgi:hypothetical protein
MSCRNSFVFGDGKDDDSGFRVKIGDFGASLLEGHDFPSTLCEETQYGLPLRGRLFNDRPPIKRELFALGSAMYEIVAWKRPFQGLADEEVEARYARDEFPALEDCPLGRVIRGCWYEEFESAQEVVEALAQCISSV